MRSVGRVRIGNQTAASAASALEPFEYAVARGFDAFEWFPDKQPDGSGWDDTELPMALRESIRRAARQHDISLSVHGSWRSTPLTAAGSGQVLRQADFATDIGADVFVLHPFVEEGIDRYLQAIVPLVTRLSEGGIRLAIENTPQMSPAAMNELLGRARAGALRAHDVGMCLDVGHANLCSETRNDYLRYFDELSGGTPVTHVHLHENWGDRDDHLTMLTGPAGRDGSGLEGLASRLARRRFAGCIILEQWPRPPQLLDAARDRLIDLLSGRPGGGATSASQRPT